MAAKTTYEEMEQKIKDLEREVAKLKQTEEALRDCELFFSQAQRVAGTGSWQIDLHTGVQKLSPMMRDIYGIEKTDINMEEGFSHVHPDDRTKAVAAYEETMASGVGVPLEYRIVRPDGEVRTVYSPRALLIHDDDGNPTKMIGVSQDITERKHVEDALQESEERYKTICESAAEGIIIADVETREFVYANPAICKMLGFTKDELEKKRVDDIHPKEDLEHVLSELELQTQGKKPLAPNLPCLRKDGTIIYMDICASSINFRGKICVVGFFTDITERKRAQEELEEAYSIVNISPAVVFRWLNEEGWPVGFVSENVNNVFGYTAKEFTSGEISYAEIIHSEDLERVMGEVIKYSADKNRVNFVHEPYRIIAKDGDVKWLDDRTHIRRDSQGEITYYQGVVLDITERLSAVEKAREHEAQLAHFSRLRTLQEMTSELAHEIDQPLCAILTNTHACLRMMRSGSGTADELVDAMEEIVTQVERANGVVQRVRGFARKQDPQRELVDIHEVIRDSLGMLRPRTYRHNIKVGLELSGGAAGERTPLFVMADTILVSTVVVCLVRNAIESLTEGETAERNIVIRSDDTDSKMVEISVADTGEGIPEDLAEKIFDPFLTTKDDGLGVGLSLSRSIIESHGGRLLAKPNPEGGATFSFTLPKAT